MEGFWIDRGEVTVEGWNVCAEVGRCPTLPLVASVGKSPEPGQPVANVSVEQAESYCRWAGGRLPHADEWLAAALGEKGSRFPWGQTGLVCRRAVYGVVRGPCAQGSTQPEIGGTRPDGATPEGLVDVVGNVGELVLGANGPEIRGGSFQSELASQLRTWSVLPYGGPQPDVGFRCVYDQPTPDGGEARANR